MGKNEQTPCLGRKLWRAITTALIAGARRQCRSYEPPLTDGGSGLGRVGDRYARLAMAVIERAILDAMAPSASARHDDGVLFMRRDLGRLDAWAEVAGVDPEWMSEAYIRGAGKIPCMALRLRWDPGVRPM